MSIHACPRPGRIARARAALDGVARRRMARARRNAVRRRALAGRPYSRDDRLITPLGCRRLIAACGFERTRDVARAFKVSTRAVRLWCAQGGNGPPPHVARILRDLKAGRIALDDLSKLRTRLRTKRNF